MRMQERKGQHKSLPVVNNIPDLHEELKIKGNKPPLVLLAWVGYLAPALCNAFGLVAP